MTLLLFFVYLRCQIRNGGGVMMDLTLEFIGGVFVYLIMVIILGLAYNILKRNFFEKFIIGFYNPLMFLFHNIVYAVLFYFNDSVRLLVFGVPLPMMYLFLNLVYLDLIIRVRKFLYETQVEKEKFDAFVESRVKKMEKGILIVFAVTYFNLLMLVMWH